MSLSQKVAAALERRALLQADPATNAYRLINRAADGFPDLAVDRYADVLVAHVYSQGRRVQPPTRVLEALAEQVDAGTAYVKYRPAQARTLDEAGRRELAPPEPLFGADRAEVEVLENGLRYLIRPGDGLSTGLFLDMRDMRAWIQAQVRGRTVLNCFAYTCAFGVAALSGGAARAANLDVSRRYLDWGKHNCALNGFAPPATDFIFGDVFDWLARFRRAGTTFDLVILDPPSFATTRKTRFAVEDDYASLVAAAAPVVAPGGTLLAAANTHTVAQRAFIAQVRQGLAGFDARVLRVTNEPQLDFASAPGEAPYLKVCQVQFGQQS